jgi:hypothetical protein
MLRERAATLRLQALASAQQVHSVSVLSVHTDVGGGYVARWRTHDTGATAFEAQFMRGLSRNTADMPYLEIRYLLKRADSSGVPRSCVCRCGQGCGSAGVGEDDVACRWRPP